jgi:hypothetical protein
MVELNLQLILLKFIHVLNKIFMMIYVFIFRTNKYDLYFSIYIFLIFLHWLLFKNECILSYLEKKLLIKIIY